jgi:FkbM family methyltransferase
VKSATVTALLRLYRWVAGSGLLERPRPRRAFESVYLAYKRLIEAGPVSRLRPWAAPGTTVVDVGANIGFFTVRFSRWVGPAGRVVAIEPEARNVASLRRRVERAGLVGVVECVHAAAAERAGTVSLELNPVHPGDHHLGEGGVPVAAVTLDELMAGDRRPVSLIKIDVQGAELRVLQGAARVIAEDRPAIFMEVDDSSLRRLGTSAQELTATLSALGYRGRVLTRSGLGPVEAPEKLAQRSVSSYIDVLFLNEEAATSTPACR